MYVAQGVLKAELVWAAAFCIVELHGVHGIVPHYEDGLCANFCKKARAASPTSAGTESPLLPHACPWTFVRPRLVTYVPSGQSACLAVRSPGFSFGMRDSTSHCCDSRLAGMRFLKGAKADH